MPGQYVKPYVKTNKNDFINVELSSSGGITSRACARNSFLSAVVLRGEKSICREEACTQRRTTSRISLGEQLL